MRIKVTSIMDADAVELAEAMAGDPAAFGEFWYHFGKALEHRGISGATLEPFADAIMCGRKTIDDPLGQRDGRVFERIVDIARGKREISALGKAPSGRAFVLATD